MTNSYMIVYAKKFAQLILKYILFAENILSVARLGEVQFV